MDSPEKGSKASALNSLMFARSFEQEDHLIENPIVKPHVIRGRRRVSFRKSNLRWLGLFFQCFLLSGQKYCFDNPQALQSSLTSPEFLNLSSAQYNLLYSFYSSTNIILPLVGGFLIDKLSIRLSLFVFSSILIVGQSVFLVGGSTMNYTCMLVGRLIFGLGGECMAVTQTSSIARWFKNKELALALSLALGCNKMGSLLNSSLTPYLFSISQNYSTPLGVGLIVCIFSWFSGLALNYMDKESDKREGKIVEVDEDEEEKVYHTVNFKDFFEFKLIYWLIVAVLALSYGSLLTFTGNANDLYSKSFRLDIQTAGMYVTVIYLTSGILLPFVGWFIDSFGKRTWVMMYSLICFMIVHSCLISFDQNTPKSFLIVPVIFCGMFYACFSGFIWNSIAIVVREDQLGMAYGGAYALININLVLTPLIYGVIHDDTSNFKFGYYWAEMFLIGQIIICFVVGVIIIIIDWKGDKKLVKRIEKREIYHSLQRQASTSFMSFG